VLQLEQVALKSKEFAEVHPAVASRCGGARVAVCHLEFHLFIMAIEQLLLGGLQQTHPVR